MLKTAKKVFMVLMILFIVVLHYFYFSSPGRVVVNKNGEIYGLENKARAALQGKKFWRDQLQEVRQEIEWEEFGILRKAANDRILGKIGQDINREIEKYYRRYPQISVITSYSIHYTKLYEVIRKKAKGTTKRMME